MVVQTGDLTRKSKWKSPLHKFIFNFGLWESSEIKCQDKWEAHRRKISQSLGRNMAAWNEDQKEQAPKAVPQRH